MRIQLLIAICVLFISTIHGQSVYNCGVINPLVVQEIIDETQGEFHKQCILFGENNPYYFWGSYNKLITSESKIHIKPGFHAGQFSQDGGIHLKIDQSPINIYSISHNDLNGIEQFGKFEFKVELPDSIQNRIDEFVDGGSQVDKLNPFDPQQIDIKAEFYVFHLGEWRGPFKKFGFYFEDYQRNIQDGTWSEIIHSNGHFRVRFAPRISGLWKCKVSIGINEVENVFVANDFMFNVIDVGLPDFLRVGDNKTYLMTRNDPFFPVGINLPFQGVDSNSYDSVRMPSNLYPHFHTVVKDLEDKGANYFRFMFAPWSSDIEFEKLGNYSDRMDIAWEMDKLIDTLDPTKMRMHLNLGYHTPFTQPNTEYGKWFWDWSAIGDPELSACNWFLNDSGYCYHTDPDFGVLNPEEFLVNEDSKRFYKNKLRYIISRWGYSTSIGMIEFPNEMTNFGRGSDLFINYDDQGNPYCDGDGALDYEPYHDDPSLPEKVFLWHHEMGSYIKNDLGHFDQPLSVSYGGLPKVDNAIFGDGAEINEGDFSYYSQFIDVASYNYYSANWDKFIIQQKKIEEMEYVLTPPIIDPNTPFSKPIMYSEQGRGDRDDRCDKGHSYMQQIIMSSFTGSLGAGLPFSFSNLSDDEYYDPDRSLYLSVIPAVKEFFQGIHLDAGPWEIGRDVRDDNKAELLYLRSQEDNKRAVGVINNRTVNSFTQRDQYCDSVNCGCFPSTAPPTVYANSESFDFNDGAGNNISNRLTIENLGGWPHKYEINFYDAFNGQHLGMVEKNAIFGKLLIRYPTLGDATLGYYNNQESPIILLKVHRQSAGAFKEIDSTLQSNELEYLDRFLLNQPVTGHPQPIVEEEQSDVENTMNLDEIKIVPNPTSQNIVIMIPNTVQHKIETIELLSCNGITLKAIDYSGDNQFLDLSPFENGIYYIRLQGNDYFELKKVIKL